MPSTESIVNTELRADYRALEAIAAKQQHHSQLVEVADAVYRWRSIFQILGLDRAAGLYAELGLNPAHAASWRAAARTFLSAYYARWDASTHEAWAWDDWQPEEGAAWVRAAFAHASELEGDAAAQALYAWGMGTFLQGDYAAEAVANWASVLRSLDAQHASVRMPTGLPSPREAELVAAYQQLFVPPVSELVAMAEALPTSVWDAQIYTRYWQQLEDDRHALSPLDAVAETVNYRRVRDLAAILQRTWSTTDFATLWQWAKAEAQRCHWPPADQLPLLPA
jgi:hypothetical protein